MEKSIELPGTASNVSSSGSHGQSRRPTTSGDDSPVNPFSNSSMPMSQLAKRRVSFNIKRTKDSIVQQKVLLMNKKIKEKEMKDKGVFNFAVGDGDHCKMVQYEEKSLMVLSRHNSLRQFFVRLNLHPWFENFILTMILVNAIFFSIADYENVDENGVLVDTGSTRNALLIRTNLFFVVVFTFEFVVKVIAQGLWGNSGSYLDDSWNYLDFFVVLTGLIITFDSSIPSISSIRLIRILRPLRSLTMLPGLRDIVKSIFASLPELGGVFSLLGFIFLVFAIAGMELFGGVGGHARCRYTPYPVNTTWTPELGVSYEPYRCISGPTYNIMANNPELGKASSPWATPQDCYWPVVNTLGPDEESLRLCSLNNDGKNVCLHNDPTVDESLWSWCGSNFDATGNRRFLDLDHGGSSNPNSKDMYRNGKYVLNDRDMFIEDLNFGYTSFDNFGSSCLTIFQAITEEGWTKILYMTMDAHGRITGGVYFTLLILLGVFFVLQLLLAVLEDNFNSAKEAVKIATEEEKRIKAEADRLDKLERVKRKDLLGRKMIGDIKKDSRRVSIMDMPKGGEKDEESCRILTNIFRENAIRKQSIRMGLTPKQRVSINHAFTKRRKHTLGLINTDSDESSSKNSIKNSIKSTDSGISGKTHSKKLLQTARFTFRGIQESSRKFFQSFKSDISSGKTEGGGALPHTLSFFVRQRERENESISRLPHLTLEEFTGSTFANFLDDGWTDFKSEIYEMFCSVKSAIKRMLEPDVDLLMPARDETFKDRMVFYATKTVTWNHFEALSGIFILANCVTLMADHYPMDTSTASILDICNAMLTILFFFEMCLNLTAYGLSYYGKDTLTSFDAFVVIASVADLCLAPPDLWGSTGIDISSVSSVSSVISMMRCFRLFRIIKLAVKVKSLKILFARVARTVVDLTTYMILLMVLIFIYTVVGLQFFANMFRFDENGEHIKKIGSPEWINAPEIPRYNFNDFTSSFASVFQIITTENWNDIMYNSWRVYGPAGVLYSCSLVMVGTFILMNLFLGILLSNFEDKGESDEFSEDNSREGSPTKELDADDSDNDSSSTDDEKERDEHAKRAAHAKGGLLVQKSLFGGSLSTLFESKPKVKKKRGKKVAPEGVVTKTVGKAPGFVLTPSKVAPMPKELIEYDPDHDEDIEVGKITSAAAENKNRRRVVSFNNGEDDIRGAAPVIQENSTPKGVVHIDSMVHRSDTIDSENYESNDQDSVFPLNRVFVLGLLGPENKFRIFCGRVLGNSWFETMIQVLILVSSISLAVDNPLDNPVSAFRDALYYFELITTALFTLETVIKIIVLGFIGNKNSYLRSGWNILDFMIVIISLFTVAGVDGLKALKSIRSLRALRPLRVISRAPGLRTIVNAVFDSIPDVINVLAVVLVCFSIFAVVSVNFLKGDLRHCAGDHFDTFISGNSSAMTLMQYPVAWDHMSYDEKTFFGPTSRVANYTLSTCASGFPSSSCCPNIMPLDNMLSPTGRQICECWGGSWEPVAYASLDNYPEALMAFFTISTTEGWVDLMYAAVDANGIDMQPIRNTSYAYVYFFVLFIVSGNFFALNLFVGVMIDNFEKTKFAMQGDLVFMTPEQQEWTKAQKAVQGLRPHLQPRPPKDSKIGEFCFWLGNTHQFEIVVVVLIFINTIVMASAYFGIDDMTRMIFDTMNEAFAYLFTVEMLIKLIGLRGYYFDSVWNIFDFIVTLGSDFGIIYYYISGNEGAMAVMVVRIFRVLRVVRLMEGLETAKRLLDTLVLTLPGIINITLLLVLVLFIYAVLGMQLFAKTQYNESYSVHTNFRTFESSLLALVRFATGEGWGNFMYDASVSKEGCVRDPIYDEDMCGFNNKGNCVELNGCGNAAIFPFLLSFTLFVSMVLFNLFVGVIIEGFSEANDITKTLSNDDFNRYCGHWAKFDQEATCFMSIENLEEFVATLFSPLGLADRTPSHNETVHFLCSLDIHIYKVNGESNFVHFKEVLVSLVTRTISHKKGLGTELESLMDNLSFADDATYKKTRESGGEKVGRTPGSQNSNSMSSRDDSVDPSHFDVTNPHVFALGEHYAAIYTQQAFRRHRYKRVAHKIHDIALKEHIRTKKYNSSMHTVDGEAKRDLSVDISGLTITPILSKTNSIDRETETPTPSPPKKEKENTLEDVQEGVEFVSGIDQENASKINNIKSVVDPLHSDKKTVHATVETTEDTIVMDRKEKEKKKEDSTGVDNGKAPIVYVDEKEKNERNKKELKKIHDNPDKYNIDSSDDEGDIAPPTTLVSSEKKSKEEQKTADQEDSSDDEPNLAPPPTLNSSEKKTESKEKTVHQKDSSGKIDEPNIAPPTSLISLESPKIPNKVPNVKATVSKTKELVSKKQHVLEKKDTPKARSTVVSNSLSSTKNSSQKNNSIASKKSQRSGKGK